MDADAQLKCVIRFVLDLEASNFFEQVQGCVCHFGRVAVSVAMWKTAYQHVGVTNRLHLASNQLFKLKAHNYVDTGGSGHAIIVTWLSLQNKCWD